MALTQKDRRALAIGIGTLVLFLLVQFVLFPLLDKRKRLDRGISTKQKGLVEMQEMQSRYHQLSMQSNTIEKRVSRRSGEFGLFSFLEKMAAEAKVKGNIADLAKKQNPLIVYLGIIMHFFCLILRLNQVDSC
jgi:general secretion pathway protein M